MEMEVEEQQQHQQKKSPITLDWGKLFRKENGAQPPEIVVVAAQDEEQKKQQVEMEGFTDHQLREKVKRLRSQINSPYLKLPDNGAKLRLSFKHNEEELARREQIKRQKEVEYENSKRSRSSCSTGACNGFISEAQSSQAQSQSKFCSLWAPHLMEKPDMSTRLSVDPVTKTLKPLNRGNHERIRSNGLLLNKGREIKDSSRQSPFRSSKIPSRDENEHRSPIGARKTHDTSTFYKPCQDRKSSTSSSKRGKDSQDQTSKNARAKECETVDLVDEEDCQLAEETHQEDEQVEWRETIIYYPSRNDPESVELRSSDIKCLDPQAFLSSTIMNFYIRHLQRPVSDTGRPRSDYHFFSTYFYEKLKEAVSCKRNDKDTFFSKLRRWWKGVNIFEKAYILLPINENFHWSLVIICLPNKEDESGPIILHLDSLGYHNSTQIFGNVKSFLREEWDCLNQSGDQTQRLLPSRIAEKRITVPQQKNDYDCGIFVLFFMKRFIKQAPPRLTKKDLAMFGKDWFKPEKASRLRWKIRKLVKEEFKKPAVEYENKESSLTSSDDGCPIDIIANGDS